MNDLTTPSAALPATIEDLSRFVLLGREKLTSVRAEIRAIDKLQLAEEVRNQKRDEARMLSEALLDAEVRLGELTQKIPKATKGNQYTGKMVPDSGVANQYKGGKPTAVSLSQTPDSGVVSKTKAEVIRELGFTPKQVERFETLADHPDLVEQVKAEARENDDLPTRSAVLSLVKYKEEKAKAEYQQIDEDGRLAKALSRAVGAIEQLPDDMSSMEAMLRGSSVVADGMRTSINVAIRKLTAIQRTFERGTGHYE